MSGLVVILCLLFAGGLIAMVLSLLFPHIEATDRWTASAGILGIVGLLMRAIEAAQ